MEAGLGAGARELRPERKLTLKEERQGEPAERGGGGSPSEPLALQMHMQQA